MNADNTATNEMQIEKTLNRLGEILLELHEAGVQVAISKDDIWLDNAPRKLMEVLERHGLRRNSRDAEDARRPGRPRIPVDIVQIHAMRAAGHSLRQISRATGTSKTRVSAILKVPL